MSLRLRAPPSDFGCVIKIYFIYPRNSNSEERLGDMCFLVFFAENPDVEIWSIEIEGVFVVLLEGRVLLLFAQEAVAGDKHLDFDAHEAAEGILEGVMIVDDISTHQAFANFAQDFPSLETLVCPHSDRASCFGLVHKPTK